MITIMEYTNRTVQNADNRVLILIWLVMHSLVQDSDSEDVDAGCCSQDSLLAELKLVLQYLVCD